MDGNRRIDEMVHTKVMGNIVRDVRICGSTNTVRCFLPPDYANPQDGVWTKHQLECHWGQPAEYSADISSAWNVVEKMRATELRTVIIPDWGTEWNAEIYKREVLICQSRFLKSAPLAICVAALKAVGVDADQIESALEAK